MKRLLALTLGGPLLAACVAPPGSDPVRIEHVVLCWLEEPGNPEHRRAVIEASEALRAIPEVRRLQVGVALPSERTVVDDSFDVALVIGFASAEDLAVYETHPEHVRRVEQVFAPLSARIVVHDIVVAH
ncbi:MAG: Dabb family protein [Planctomycetota bacterium]